MPATSSRNDPLAAFRFAIELDGLPVAGFSECSGLQMEIEVKDYNEGGLNSHVHRFPGRSKQGSLTLKRGIVDRDLWTWYYDLTQGQVQLRGGSITVKDPSGGTDVMVWEFTDAFPNKWIGPDLNASQNNVAVETLELAYQTLKRTT
jgi:phage tail-like protein